MSIFTACIKIAIAATPYLIESIPATGIFNSNSSSFKNTISKSTQALLALSFQIAKVDGPIDCKERQVIYAAFSSVEKSALDSEIEKIAQSSCFPRNISKYFYTKESCSQVVRLLYSIALCDQMLDKSEVNYIKKVCSQLGMNECERISIQSEFNVDTAPPPKTLCFQQHFKRIWSVFSKISKK
ncbi:TerB family tellurite resistance protein [Solidesulfovibrio alcoholivorans]|uniref:TerB family tellurite resistance protein n=1 Tax=Solidesulfovibrio alcoholivorans TaxID=81406 RepID=UPI000A052B13|nr:TerB family tellurite resistance protein [Solidesulfovibrio alcoholivorans]